METIDKIDVTILEPRMKHPTIFKKFDEITQGESFLIFNDHDPKPLYYQLIGERGNIFNWEYLESGPEIWQVKISKYKSGSKESTIGEVIAKDFRKAEVFKKYKIDFCCGGKKTLSEVCIDKQLDIVEINNQLNKLDSEVLLGSQNYKDWDLSFLIDYIVNTHHKYIKASIPILLEYTSKVAKVHGANHIEAIAISELFKQATEELESHMMKEETVLFPYIKNIAANSNVSTEIHCSFGSISNPIRVMEHEHETVGNIFKTIRELSNDYTPPLDACTTFKLSYLKLQEFENDLHQHIHLENNILFPKSILLETQLS
jgi:regulator of cell morphogenesis and NO signaling